jgi:hypothetical protein
MAETRCAAIESLHSVHVDIVFVSELLDDPIGQEINIPLDACPADGGHEPAAFVLRNRPSTTRVRFQLCAAGYASNVVGVHLISQPHPSENRSGDSSGFLIAAIGGGYEIDPIGAIGDVDDYEHHMVVPLHEFSGILFALVSPMAHRIPRL